MTAKKLITLALAILLTLPLAACGKAESYRDDVSASALSDTVSAKIPAEGGYDIFLPAKNGEEDLGGAFLSYYFNGNQAIDDFAIASSTVSSDVNEYGILHVSDIEQVAEVEEMAQVYLSNQRDFLSTFVNTYNAAEMAKLEEATVRVFGNYIVYTILSEADTQAVMAAVEDMLKH